MDLSRKITQIKSSKKSPNPLYTLLDLHLLSVPSEAEMSSLSTSVPLRSPANGVPAEMLSPHS